MKWNHCSALLSAALLLGMAAPAAMAADVDLAPLEKPSLIAAQEDEACSRERFVQSLWELCGKPAAQKDAPAFTDVTADRASAQAIRWAADCGLTSGYQDGTFRPAAPLSRQQMAVMIYRTVQTMGMGFQGAWMFPLNFADAEDVGQWASEAMHWAVMSHVLEGKDKRLLPNEPATRSVTETALEQFAALAKEKKVDLSTIAPKELCEGLPLAPAQKA